MIDSDTIKVYLWVSGLSMFLNINPTALCVWMNSKDIKVPQNGEQNRTQNKGLFKLVGQFLLYNFCVLDKAKIRQSGKTKLDNIKSNKSMSNHFPKRKWQ